MNVKADNRIECLWVPELAMFKVTQYPDKKAFAFQEPAAERIAQQEAAWAPIFNAAKDNPESIAVMNL